jgi:hypothetical protein
MRKSLLLLLGVGLSVGNTMAQLASTTSLVGNISDQGGAAMAGVQVLAVNEGTAEKISAVTGSEGYYSFQFVKVGTYTITASQAGFQTLTKTSIRVETNQTVRTDFAMTVGRVTEKVMVSAEPPPLATDDATLSETISTKATVDLPVSGRNALRLAAITPGVLPGFKSPATNPGGGEDLVAAGTREIQNSVSLDGVSIMNNLGSQVTFRPSIDAVQELQIQTGTYGAQYGGYLGLQLNLVTRSGTNDFHGSAFEFVRNSFFDARGFFQKKPTPQSPFHQNQFGFYVGGPVWIPKLYRGQNRTFFMVNYEGLRQSQSVAQLDTVLTPLMRQGNFSELSKAIVNPRPGGAPFQGNIIPVSLLSPQALLTLKYMPQAPPAGIISSNYLASVVNANNTNQTIDRIDQNFGERTRLFFRYGWMNTNLVNGSTNPFNGYNQPVGNRNFVFGYTQVFSPSLVNDLHFGRQHSTIDSVNFFNTPALASAGTDLGIPTFTTTLANSGLPDFEITGFMPIGGQNMSSSNWYQIDTTWQGADVLSYTRGAHSMSAGAEVRKLITLRTANNNPRGQFNFSGTLTGGASAAADFMLGLPLSVVTPGPLIQGGVATYRDGFFFADKWQASKKLTVTLGLRYELPTVPESTNGNGTILDPGQTHFIPATVPQKIPYINAFHNIWEPRVGLAFRLSDKWVVRSGYGIFFNPNHTNTFTLATTNPPFSTIFTYNTNTANPDLSLANPTPASAQGALPKPNAFTINPDLHPASMNQWSADLERALWRNAGLDIQYLGSRTVHLDRSFFNNRPGPGPGNIDARRPNQLFRDIRTIQNDEVSTYNGLNIVLRQNPFHGLSMLLSYTWAHSLDVSSDSNNGGAPMNSYAWWLDYASSNWDVRHRLVGSFTYDLPFLRFTPNAFVKAAFGNWQLNGIITAQTGFPYNITVPGDPANTSAGSQRPNLLTQPSSNCGQGHLTGCINSAAFALPATFTYGAAGRNLLRGPDLATLDLSLFKNFAIRERATFQLRGEFFNALNHPSFSNPNSVFNTAAFGNITSTSTNNRQIQLAGKFTF